MVFACLRCTGLICKFAEGNFHRSFLNSLNCKILPIKKSFSSDSSDINENKLIIDEKKFDYIASEALELLTERIEVLLELESSPPNADVSYSDGVLTLKLGNRGTYVINRQRPNRQIWFSSPTSGPKRYDFENGTWRYKHDDKTLHELLTEELSKIFNEKVDLS